MEDMEKLLIQCLELLKGYDKTVGKIVQEKYDELKRKRSYPIPNVGREDLDSVMGGNKVCGCGNNKYCPCAHL